MLIQSVKLTNFLGVSDAYHKMKKMTVVSGVNGSGKSAIKDALAFVFANHLFRDGNPVKTGEQYAEVAIQTDLGYFEKRQTAAGSITYKFNAQKMGWQEFSKTIEERTGANTEQIKACLETGNLFDLKPDQRRSLVARAFNVEVNKDLIIEHLTKQDSEKAWPAILDRMAETIPGINWNDPTGKLHKTLAKERLDREKLAANIEGQLQSLKSLNPIPAKDLENWRKELNILKGQRDKLIQESSETTITQINNQIAEKQALIDSPDNSEAIAEKEKAFQDAQKQVVSVMSEIDTVKVSQNDMTSTLKASQKRLQGIKDLSEGYCPTCGQKVEQSLIDDLIKKAEDDVTDTSEVLEKINSRLMQLSTEKSGIEYQKTNIENELNRLKAEHKDIDRVTLAAEVDGLRKKVGQLKSGDKTKAVEELDVKIDGLSHDIYTADEANKGLASMESLSKELDRYNMQVEILRILEKVYGERGLKAELVREKAIEVAREVNARLRYLGYGNAEIVTIDHLGKETFDIRIADRPVGSYSDGEITAIGAIMQVFLATATGFGVLVVERGEAMTADTRKKVLSVLMSSLESFGTAVILTARDEPKSQAGSSVLEVIDLPNPNSTH